MTPLENQMSYDDNELGDDIFGDSNFEVESSIDDIIVDNEEYSAYCPPQTIVTPDIEINPFKRGPLHSKRHKG